MRSQRVSKTLSLYPKSIFSNFGICGVKGCFWNLESEVMNLYRRGTMKDVICFLLFPTRRLQASQDPSICQLSVQRDCPHWETATAVQVLCSFPHSCNALSPSFCQQGRSEVYITWYITVYHIYLSDQPPFPRCRHWTQKPQLSLKQQYSSKYTVFSMYVHSPVCSAPGLE